MVGEGIGRVGHVVGEGQCTRLTCPRCAKRGPAKRGPAHQPHMPCPFLHMPCPRADKACAFADKACAFPPYFLFPGFPWQILRCETPPVQEPDTFVPCSHPTLSVRALLTPRKGCLASSLSLPFVRSLSSCVCCHVCVVMCVMCTYSAPKRPSPTLSPTDPVPRGLLTLCPGAY